MVPSAQLSIFESAEKDNEVELWFGLAVDHRTVFDSFQKEWFGYDSEFTVAVCNFFERPHEKYENQILTYLKLSFSELPAFKVMAKSGDNWVEKESHDVKASDSLICWRGGIPTYIIKELFVSNIEELARLTGISRQVSNILLPKVSVKSGIHTIKCSNPMPDSPGGLLQPDSKIDSIRGAMAMAIYSVPRMGPWLDLLVGFFGRSSDKARKQADAFDAPWLLEAPWDVALKHNSSSNKDDFQSVLWVATVLALFDLRKESRVSPEKIVENISIYLNEYASSFYKQTLEWENAIGLLLASKEDVNMSNWKQHPVERAVSIFLLRPEPSKVVTWLEDMPDLPPPVWWTAATLSGLFYGYEKLENRFRGDVLQRKFTSIFSYQYSASDVKLCKDEINSSFSWSRSGASLQISWQNQVLWSKAESPRGVWFEKNNLDSKLIKDALEIAKKNKWPCIHKLITINDDVIDLLAAKRQPNIENDKICFDGEFTLRLPLGSLITDELEIEKFKICLATEGAKDIPMPRGVAPKLLNSANSPIEGMRFISEFIDSDKELDLLSNIEKHPWMNDLERRVQHYGWKYDYKAKKINKDMRLGPLPEWAKELADAMNILGLMPYVPDQLIVNEYIGNQGISKHVDCIPCFEDTIAMISLLETWDMNFQEIKGEKRKLQMQLDRGSLLVLTGKARYDWTHEIPKRKLTSSGLHRGRRISLTFRKVKTK